MKEMVCSPVCAGSRRPLITSSVSGRCLFCGDTRRNADTLCVVMSPTRSRLLELAEDIAAAQLRNGGHSV